ncbi:MAG TPA: hypothetical protein VLA23_02680 [Candidatus Limnocylindrales bacterium]|nr:hypothetical protein [Candidatus Limnocylindrales bacterium]
MIRNAVIHIANEQPLIADLFRMPEPADQGLLLTNLRTLSGTRPVFIDDSAGTFFFPYRFIRFVEIPAAAASGSAKAIDEDQVAGEPDEDLDLDEDFLRRIREV